MKLLVSLVVLVGIFLSATKAQADDTRLIIDTGGHKSIIRDVIFTSDGRFLVSAGDDKVVRVWDTQTGEVVRTIRGQIEDGLEGQIFAAALSPDERILAVGGYLGKLGDGRSAGRIRLHDFQTGEVLGLLKGHSNIVNSLAFSPDGRYLASGSFDETVRLWDVNQQTIIHVLKGHTEPISAVAFSPDGKRIASGSNDDTIRLWDVQRGDLIKELTGHENNVVAVAFSPNGQYMVSGSDDKTIRLWDTKTGEFIKVLARQNRRARSLSLSPDGMRLLTGAGGGGSGGVGFTTNILAVPSGEVLTRFTQHDNIVLATAFSPDGTIAATGGGTQNQIYLWKANNGDVVKKLEGKGQSVWSVGFAKDGQSIAFGQVLADSNGNIRGPLQQIFQLNQQNTTIALSGKVKDSEQYHRAIDRLGDFELRAIEGGNYGYQAILQMVKNEKVVHEIERVSTTGYGHWSYTFSPDNKFIISGGANGVLTRYEVGSDEKPKNFIGHTGVVWAVAVSPDSRTLVSGSDDQTIRLWDIASGKNLLTIFVGSDQEWVAWTPEGYYTSSLNGDKYIGWHVNKGEDQTAVFYPASQFQQQFYRPDVVAAYLDTRDITIALKQANANREPELTAQPVDPTPNIQESLPPVLFVYHPDTKEVTVDSGTLTVKAVAQSQNLPLIDVKILLNGIQMAGTPEGPIKGKPLRRLVELEIPLREGKNILRVIAAHEKATSDPEVRTIYYTPKEGVPSHVDSTRNLFFLGIGISDYKHAAFQLEFADDDATVLAKRLTTQKGQLYDDVQAEVLANKDATRGEIIRKLNWFRTAGTDRDVRILFLSGHGDIEEQQYYFLSHEQHPQDRLNVDGVSWKSVLDSLTAIPGDTILLLDTCRATGLVNGVQSKDARAADIDPVLRRIKEGFPGLVTFTASKGTQPAFELKSKGHGAFTQALLEGLAGKADGYGGKEDGKIETKELGSWVIDRVKALTDDQQIARFLPSADRDPVLLYQLH